MIQIPTTMIQMKRNPTIILVIDLRLQGDQ